MLTFPEDWFSGDYESWNGQSFLLDGLSFDRVEPDLTPPDCYYITLPVAVYGCGYYYCVEDPGSPGNFVQFSLHWLAPEGDNTQIYIKVTRTMGTCPDYVHVVDDAASFSLLAYIEECDGSCSDIDCCDTSSYTYTVWDAPEVGGSWPLGSPSAFPTIAPVGCFDG